MIAINITKFTSYTPHYYCNFYVSISGMITIDWMHGNDFNIPDTDTFESLEKKYGNEYKSIKSTNERDLYKMSLEILKERWSPLQLNGIAVFYEGKFSKERTILLNDLYHNIE